MRIINKIKNKLQEIICCIENRDCNKRFERTIDSEIETDIKLIGSIALKPYCEKDSDKVLVESVSAQIIRRYLSRYSPVFNIKQLTNKNQERYFHLRLKIDKAIEEAKPYVHLD